MLTKIKFNHSAIGRLLKSAAVARDLKRRADRVAEAAGPGMLASVRTGRTRARASVITSTVEAQLAEAHSKALIRAFGRAAG